MKTFFEKEKKEKEVQDNISKTLSSNNPKKSQIFSFGKSQNEKAAIYPSIPDKSLFNKTNDNIIINNDNSLFYKKYKNSQSHLFDNNIIKKAEEIDFDAAGNPILPNNEVAIQKKEIDLMTVELLNKPKNSKKSKDKSKQNKKEIKEKKNKCLIEKDKENKNLIGLNEENKKIKAHVFFSLEEKNYYDNKKEKISETENNANCEDSQKGNKSKYSFQEILNSVNQESNVLSGNNTSFLEFKDKEIKNNKMKENIFANLFKVKNGNENFKSFFLK